MEEIDYPELIKIIESHSKNSYQGVEINGKLRPNVANLGAKAGDIAKLERSGEYYGIAVEFLGDVKPLLTSQLIIRILNLLKNEDYVTPMTILNLINLDQLKYILHEWFQKATTIGDKGMLKDYNKKYPVFDHWIQSVRSDPLPGPIKVVEIGQNQNTGISVLPPEWIGTEFSDGRAMHEAMDKLETRIGKPPVTYAVIYSMVIQKYDSNIRDIKNLSYDYIFYLDLVADKLISTIATEVKGAKTGEIYDYVKYDNILVGFVLNDIIEPKGPIVGEHSQEKLREVGMLVSRLQKSIRRGRYASKILSETVMALNKSPNYNLPEHGFLRVSASKQLVWRLFISILEDCRPYQENEGDANNELGLLELVLLVLITQKCQEYKFTKTVLEAVRKTALLAQYNDSPDDLYDWRTDIESISTPIIPNSKYHSAISLVLNNVIMMAGDRRMLRKLYSIDNQFKPFDIPKKIFHDPKIYEDVQLSSIDPHVKTYIILYYQACIPISLTTKEISKYIWDRSSSYNVRTGKKAPKKDPILRKIQMYFLKEEHKMKYHHQTVKSSKIELIKPSVQVKRSSFLIMFGQKYKYYGKEVVLTGTSSEPARIKIKNEWVHSNDADIINAYPKRIINLSDIDPPFGYKWNRSTLGTKIVDGHPFADGKKIPFFDGSSVLESITPEVYASKMDIATYNLIVWTFAGLDISFQAIQMFRKTPLVSSIKNWYIRPIDMEKIEMNLIRLAYTKLFNQFNNIIMIGPVDRSGNKMQNSINYLLEGKLWAVFNLFYYLYPETLKSHGSLNFIINKKTQGYIHLVKMLEFILFSQQKIMGPIPMIKTELWDHQKESISMITAGFKKGCHGFGNADDVGAGKTLTSLGIAIELIKTNNITYSGILVMLPGNKLISTWKTELEKHTEGFDIKFQHNISDVGKIKRNTIVITTMGRMRDHPINHNWLLVIIDECLSVQNKNALQTEEAWKQSLMSKYLVMMSATFFRTRFDKLYYMLKMLQTGLPERKEYLDTILTESIVSHISQTKRKWISNINYFTLDKTTRAEYEKINNLSLNVESLYSKLTSFLISNQDVTLVTVKQLNKLINALDKKGHKCVIYARSNGEANYWSSKLGIPLYPKKGKHTIITYHDGTYGLNDLVIYNTIVMRPPAPDKLPQIKGRLDRPGQTTDDLFIEYFILKDTIEEGLILRMNIASQFIHRYIMPLAKFYDISVNYQKYLDENSE